MLCGLKTVVCSLAFWILLRISFDVSLAGMEFFCENPSDLKYWEKTVELLCLMFPGLEPGRTKG